jgi:hypothetical protein
VHLVFLFFIAPLWFLVAQTSESEDVFARTIAGVVGISGIAWASFVVVWAIRYGSKDDGIQRIFKHYRKLLNSFGFLVISDLLLVTIVVTLAYQVAAYRQMEFSSPLRGILVVNDSPNEKEIVAKLEPNTPKKVRLRTGVRHMVFQADNSVVALPPQAVQPWWRALTLPEVNIVAKDERYERAR